MEHRYIGYEFKVSPRDPFTEILIAELSMLGFDSFMESEIGVSAYILEEEWSKNLLDPVVILRSDEVDISYNCKAIEPENWNAVWEESFEPIYIRDLVCIRAPFHKVPDSNYDIVIEPKMSFGTGHHETTCMMVKHMLETDLKDKEVLDMGCGTGVLAILAEKMGARAVHAVDIDRWCYENSLENCLRNQCRLITVTQGDVTEIKGRTYDVILANINRNILLNDLEDYVLSMNPGGCLVLSGFYEEDFDILDERAGALGLSVAARDKENNWLSLKYLK
jgi:ribosomal protein L11 methyltransferase